MAINRGTRGQTFLYLLETFAIIGALAGTGWGFYLALGETPFDLAMNAIRYGFFGFIGGTVIGIVLGVLAVIFATISR